MPQSPTESEGRALRERALDATAKVGLQGLFPKRRLVGHARMPSGSIDCSSLEASNDCFCVMTVCFVRNTSEVHVKLQQSSGAWRARGIWEDVPLPKQMSWVDQTVVQLAAV